LRIGSYRVPKELSEVFFGAAAADLSGDLSASHVEGGNQALGSVAAVFELAALNPARHHRQVWGDAFKGLDPGHLVDRNRAVAGCTGL
jgi:hypothetical protein